MPKGNKYMHALGTQRCESCGEVMTGSPNSEEQCEDCARICEICGEPYYMCNDFNEESRTCGPCESQIQQNHFRQVFRNAILKK